MIGKYAINSGRIDGIQLLERRFGSLTKRQIQQLYALMVKHQLSIGDVKEVHVESPLAPIGESFGISITLNV